MQRNRGVGGGEGEGEGEGADLEERVVAVRGGAVGADAGAAGEAEDVALVLLVVLVRGARHEEALRHQAGNPPGPHPHRRRRRWISVSFSLPSSSFSGKEPEPLSSSRYSGSTIAWPGNSARPLALVCSSSGGGGVRVQGAEPRRGGSSSTLVRVSCLVAVCRERKRREREGMLAGLGVAGGNDSLRPLGDYL